MIASSKYKWTKKMPKRQNEKSHEIKKKLIFQRSKSLMALSEKTNDCK